MITPRRIIIVCCIFDPEFDLCQRRETASCAPWRRSRRVTMKRALAFLAFGVVALASAALGGEVASSLAPIPGITAEDKFPRACIDCHIVVADTGMDRRLSTLLRADQLDPAMLARIRAVLPETTRLSGRHPRLPDASFRNIPASCLLCHREAQTMLPPFAPMMHAIHLTGAGENRYLTLFGGACTNCHKLNRTNGRWSTPAGPEN
jgi:hypothetical protein